MKRIILAIAATACIAAQAGILGAIQHADGETFIDLDKTKCAIGTAARWSITGATKEGCWGPGATPGSMLIVWFDMTVSTHMVTDLVTPERSEELWPTRGSIKAPQRRAPAQRYVAPSAPPAYLPSHDVNPIWQPPTIVPMPSYSTPTPRTPAFPDAPAIEPNSRLLHQGRLSNATVIPNPLGLDPYVYRRPGDPPGQ